MEILKLENVPKIICYTDNKSLYETVKTTKLTKDLIKTPRRDFKITSNG